MAITMISKKISKHRERAVKMIKLKSALNSVYCRWKNLTTRRKSDEQLHQYWRQPYGGGNLPGQYIEVEGGNRAQSRVLRSQFLVNLIKRYSTSNAKILEIGCNAGRNLNYLFSAGFDKLAGIEINEDAVALMKESYPEMAKNAKIINEPVEDVIKNFEDDEFDIVFTMAVLEHIHPNSDFIFQEVVRITKRFLITIEDEKGVSWRHFPRNYKKIFEALGMKQIYQSNMVEGLNHNFYARVFINI